MAWDRFPLERVDWRASFSLVGSVVKHLAPKMLVSLFVAAIYREDVRAFVVSVPITVSAGLALERLDPEPRATRDTVVGLGVWLTAAASAPDTVRWDYRRSPPGL